LEPLIVICGPTGSGKTTIGRLVARRLALTHVEMSDIALAERAHFERAEGSISTLDFVESVLWYGKNWDVVVRRMSDLVTKGGLVATGPRRPEEIEALTSLSTTVDLVYLDVPMEARAMRAIRDATKQTNRETFVARTRREASWGLLDRPGQFSFRLVSNAGTVEEAVDAIARPYESIQADKDSK